MKQFIKFLTKYDKWAHVALGLIGYVLMYAVCHFAAGLTLTNVLAPFVLIIGSVVLALLKETRDIYVGGWLDMTDILYTVFGGLAIFMAHLIWLGIMY